MSSPGDGTDDTDRGDAESGIDSENRPASSVSTGGQSTDDDTPRPNQWRSADESAPPPQRTDGNQPSELQLFAYDLLSSVLAVVVVGAYLFAVSGVWPPLVAVESGSMVPNMQVNDLVFVMEEHRFPGENAHTQTGVVTARAADDDYQKFGRKGDVIVFAPQGNEQTTPIIHRAMFWVEEGENWYQRADKDFVGPAEACETDRKNSTDTGLQNCPAPHAGFITKGDHNGLYDQAGRGGAQTGPVKPAWVVGTAEFRIPGLGWVRLATQ